MKEATILKKISKVYWGVMGEQLPENIGVENGLCGGWSLIFMQYPTWLYNIWHGLEDWEIREEDLHSTDFRPDEDLLRELNEKINSYVVSPLYTNNEVIKAYEEAWNYMGILEGTDKYGSWVVDYGRNFLSVRVSPIISEINARKIIEQAPICTIHFGLTGTRKELNHHFAQQIVNKIEEIKKLKLKHKFRGSICFYIDAPKHYMAVWVIIRSQSDIRYWVLETEEYGLEIVEEKELLNIFDNDLYIAKDVRYNNESVDIRVCDCKKVFL